MFRSGPREVCALNYVPFENASAPQPRQCALSQCSLPQASGRPRPARPQHPGPAHAAPSRRPLTVHPGGSGASRSAPRLPISTKRGSTPYTPPYFFSYACKRPGRLALRILAGAQYLEHCTSRHKLLIWSICDREFSYGRVRAPLSLDFSERLLEGFLAEPPAPRLAPPPPTRQPSPSGA